ncbi:MmgE/PrpD family protein [Nonomuraea sp. NPDC046570]|uniref:MmgE/PrpD family protein n=1 Tax=Nonomuraea sp. NPDC046570 TaxID=3155255 RepID=UPI00340FE869
MTSLAVRLARWAHEYTPHQQDRQLASQGLRDTVAVILAARADPLTNVVADLPEAARWAALGHVLSYDDLHLPSTTHISAVCVPAVLACGGGERAYLGAAGVMARLGTVLGWSHYASGWHITCTTGAPAAAAGAALALGLDVDQTAAAIALAVPAAGGVQKAFGTAAKALQVGFAAEAGVRAAHLVAAGADANPAALDQWLELLGCGADEQDLSGSAVPGGLVVKLFPCCFSLQRPIHAVRSLDTVDVAQVERILVSTPESTTRPLIRHRPTSSREATLSLEYAIAATLLDGVPDFRAEAVMRPAAVRLMDRTAVEFTSGGTGLLDGEVSVVVELADGSRRCASADRLPLTGDADLAVKLSQCGPDVAQLVAALEWSDAATVLRQA